MITVFKYIINPHNTQMELPIGAEILSVGFQEDIFCMWAKVDTEAKNEVRNIKVYGTGQKIPSEIEDKLKFIGTGFMHSGLVFHVFERI